MKLNMNLTEKIDRRVGECQGLGYVVAEAEDGVALPCGESELGSHAVGIDMFDTGVKSELVQSLSGTR